MNWIVKRFRIVISIFVILSTIITYFFVYLPMKNELETTALQNFIFTSKANERTANQFIINCLEGGAAITKRSLLQDTYSKYKMDAMDYVTFVSYLHDYFIDSINALPNVKGAYRIVDSKQIASFGTGNTNDLYPKTKVATQSFDLSNNNELIVYSPIRIQGDYLGYDVVFFDLSATLNSLNLGYSIFSIVGPEKNNLFSDKGNKVIDVNQVNLIDDGEYISYLSPISGSDMSFYVKVEKAFLFHSINRISFGNLIGAILLNIALLLITNLMIIKSVQVKINQTEKSKELFKEYAYRDTLTGAYSRLYFERWAKAKTENSGMVEETISVVMIDINRYKYINDTYGHAAGDIALQRVASVLQSSVRKGDLVVRHGGDEFLLVLVNCKHAAADRILTSINNNLVKIEDMGFGISISYGIHEISHYRDLHMALQQADKRMYDSKNAYKTLLWY